VAHRALAEPQASTDRVDADVEAGHDLEFPGRLVVDGQLAAAHPSRVVARRRTACSRRLNSSSPERSARVSSRACCSSPGGGRPPPSGPGRSRCWPGSPRPSEWRSRAGRKHRAPGSPHQHPDHLVAHPERHVHLGAAGQRRAVLRLAGDVGGVVQLPVVQRPVADALPRREPPPAGASGQPTLARSTRSPVALSTRNRPRKT